LAHARERRHRCRESSAHQHHDHRGSDWLCGWQRGAGLHAHLLADRHAREPCRRALPGRRSRPGALLDHGAYDEEPPIYLFNYYHGVYIDSVLGVDNWAATQLAAAQTYANAWIAGFSDGTTSYNRAGPNGATATAALAETLLTHRDFPR
jgi:hypothetical protein